MLLVEWIFSLSVFLYSLSDSLAPYLQRTAEDKCMRTRGIFPHSEQKQDIIASSKTFSTQPGKAVASPLTCDIYIFEGFLRNPPIFNMWIMNLWLCDAVASFHLPGFNVISLEIKRFTAEFGEQDNMYKHVFPSEWKKTTLKYSEFEALS